jgi:hypothetical protein
VAKNIKAVATIVGVVSACVVVGKIVAGEKVKPGEALGALLTLASLF